MAAGKGWQELGKQGAVYCAASAQVGLDTEQLLPAGPTLVRKSRDHHVGSLCVCWCRCELLLQDIYVHTTILTP